MLLINYGKILKLKTKMDRNKLKNILQSNANKQQQMPSTFQMAKNLASTALNTVKSVAVGQGFNVSQEEADKRKAICDQCPFLNKNQDRCTKCGCYMAVKTYLRASNCPIGKW